METKVAKFEMRKMIAIIVGLLLVAVVASTFIQGSSFKGDVLSEPTRNYSQI